MGVIVQCPLLSKARPLFSADQMKLVQSLHVCRACESRSEVTGSFGGMRETLQGYGMLLRTLPGMLAVARREHWHVHSMDTE
jgi:hypothetical protein